MSEKPGGEDSARHAHQASRLFDRIVLGDGGSRPPVLLMIATAVGLAAVVAGATLWPALSHRAVIAHRPSSGARVATVTSSPSAAAEGAGAAPSPTSGAAPAPTPVGAGQPTPVPSSGSTSATAASPTPAPASAPSPLPPTSAPATFANSLLTGVGQGGFGDTGSWSSQSTGGCPSFGGPSVWTSSTSAWAEYSLGTPSGGQHWDQVRVSAWVPNVNASAWVRYTITYSNGSSQQSTSVDLAEQLSPGWNQLGTFAIGSGATRAGSIWVSQTHLMSYAGSENWAAAQVKFEWN